MDGKLPFSLLALANRRDWSLMRVWNHNEMFSRP